MNGAIVKLQRAVQVALVLLALGSPQQALAQGANLEPAATQTIELPVSEGRTLRLPEPAGTIFVADPEIADIQTPSPATIFVFGKKPGRTTLFALNPDGSTALSRRIFVFQPVEELRRTLRAELGNVDVQVRQTQNGVVVSGLVATAEIAEAVRDLAAQFVGREGVVVNKLRVNGKLQVNLRVRVVEVSRSVTKELGINWNGVGSIGEFAVGLSTGRAVLDAAGQVIRSPSGANLVSASLQGKNGNILAVVDALAENGLVSILAQPSLTAVSGESASFLAGGEFPIPVAQGNDRVSVEYRKFGVSLDFLPTVISDDLISIKVRPEVSELAEQTAVRLNGFSIPLITTRRAETTVELGSGQSFAIGGLIRNASQRSLSTLPGLGEIPVLGALFQSRRFQRNESELIIIVTPYVVRAVSNAKALQTPSIEPVPNKPVIRVVHEAQRPLRITPPRAIQRKAEPVHVPPTTVARSECTSKPALFQDFKLRSPGAAAVSIPATQGVQDCPPKIVRK